MPEEPGHALNCKRCQRIILRFRYTTDTRHMLDVCVHCEDVWLQQGEWEFLKSRQLSGALPKVFTDPWQHDRRQSAQQVALADDWNERLGIELHAEAAQLRRWLDQHPQKSELILYLTVEDPYQV